MKIELAEGKYTYLFDEATGKSEALRYGEKWRDTIGDGLILAMAQRIEDLENQPSPAPAPNAAAPTVWRYTHDGHRGPAILTENRWEKCEEPWSETGFSECAPAPGAAVPDAQQIESIMRKRGYSRSQMDNFLGTLKEVLATPPATPETVQAVTDSMVEAAFEKLDDLGFDMTRNDMKVSDMREALEAALSAPAPIETAQADVPDDDSILQLAFEIGEPFDDGSGYHFDDEQVIAFAAALLGTCPPANEQPPEVKK